MVYRTAENYDAYMNAVRGDGRAVARVVQWLRGRGDDAIYLPKTYAKRQEDIADHADSGDFKGVLRSFEQHLEYVYGVKERGLDFTCADDFPYRDITVCKKAVWDFANPKPRAFFMLNRNWTHVGIVWSSTAEFWTTREFTDHRPNRGETETLYVAPLRGVPFFDIREEGNE